MLSFCQSTFDSELYVLWEYETARIWANLSIGLYIWVAWMRAPGE